MVLSALRCRVSSNVYPLIALTIDAALKGLISTMRYIERETSGPSWLTRPRQVRRKSGIRLSVLMTAVRVYSSIVVWDTLAATLENEATVMD
jgi:hypothetical protein